MESKQAVQTPGGKGSQDNGESSHYPSYRRKSEPERAYSDSFRLTRSIPTQLSSAFQEKTRVEGQAQDFLQPKAESVRPNYTEAVGLRERTIQEPDVVLNTSNRIRSPNTRHHTPSQMEHSFVTPESSINSNALWLQMSQYTEQTQERFAKLQENNVRLEELTSSQRKIVKTLQEGYAKLRKASKENKRRLNQVLEEQNHFKRDRVFLDQDIEKLFNFGQSIKPQPQGNFLDNPYHQEDIKPDSLLENKARPLSQYQDGDNMTYS
ncbi:hypothetical protein O181_002192 [Austropuccinia psidii MF-1]|uniref:Uncharacterized protein n=1 Tax=Austropuccinia psidii MF-1 TaxID=1389203 RepID=A0A9Q3GDR3_9BASI|nr:hypothetical protein [Austropuccinia psidii MF-1]